MILKKFKTILIYCLQSLRTFVLTILVFTFFYTLFTLLLTFIPSNIFSEQPETGITIYIKSNGVHTDIVMPSENKFYNWNEKIAYKAFILDTTNYAFTSFGWGDKGFYLHTPNWSDLKITTAIDAMLLPSPTAMHVTLYTYFDIEENELTKKIILSEEQYLLLCGYIYNSFEKDRNGNFQYIKGYWYPGATNGFYEANGNYQLFNTCNNWTNEGLKEIGVKTATWAPFDKCILYHF